MKSEEYRTVNTRLKDPSTERRTKDIEQPTQVVHVGRMPRTVLHVSLFDISKQSIIRIAINPLRGFFLGAFVQLNQPTVAYNRLYI